MEITSVNNELIKNIAKLQQKKYRNESGKFILEGYKVIKEAFDFGIEIEHIFVEKKNIEDYSFAKNLVIETNEAVLKKLCSTDSAPNSVAVGIQKKYDINSIKDLKKVILLENIKDLGNLGTIIRSSVAFGVEAIILYGESVDLYNPKCIRASVGNMWKIPIIHIKQFDQLEQLFTNFERIATLPRSKNLLKSFKTKLPALIMFGSEADGLSQELIKFATNDVKIEMNPTVESLNLGISVAVITYKLFGI